MLTITDFIRLAMSLCFYHILKETAHSKIKKNIFSFCLKNRMSFKAHWTTGPVRCMHPTGPWVMIEFLSWLGYPSYNSCLRCWTDFIPSTCPTLLICVVLYTLNIGVHKCFSYFQYKLWLRILQNNYKGPDIQMTCFEEQKLRDVKGVSTEEPRYIREDGGVNMGRRQYF